MSFQGINVRNAFVAKPGYYFIDRDYKQIEFRLSALKAGEISIIEGFRNNIDYYRLIFQRMSIARGQPIEIPAITKTQRQLGKTVALGQSYGQEHWGLAQKLNIPPEQAREIMDSYWAGLPKTAEAKEKALREAYRYGGIWTHFGRWRGLPTLNSPDRREKAKAIRSVWNSMIQGFAADILKIAMVRAAKALSDAELDAGQVLNVHDELLFEVSNDEPFPIVDEKIRDAMEFPIPNLTAGVPSDHIIPTDPEYGVSWGKLMPRDEFLHLMKDQINLTGERHKGKSMVSLQQPSTVVEPIEVPVAPPIEIVTPPVLKERMVDAEISVPVASKIEETLRVEDSKESDYDYPCVMVLGQAELTEEQVAFIKALVQKAPGSHRLYLQYQGQFMVLPPELKINPIPQVIDYLRKGLASDASIDVFDANGKPALKLVAFA